MDQHDFANPAPDIFYGVDISLHPPSEYGGWLRVHRGNGTLVNEGRKLLRFPGEAAMYERHRIARFELSILEDVVAAQFLEARAPELFPGTVDADHAPIGPENLYGKRRLFHQGSEAGFAIS